MSLQNLYYKRTAATAKACYICYKPTTIVLATIDTTDFLYTCAIHLTDPGFATRVKDEVDTKVGASAEEIAKIKQEWEDKQRKKREKEKEKEKEKEEREKADKEKEDTKEKEKAADGEVDKSKKPEGSATASGQPAPSPKPTHERYVLHRDIFSIRVAEQRRRRQNAQVKTLAPRLPGTPTNTLG
ncbi:hypothetical protein ID866_10282 [Astraeus odoratus]|nr:hypothetical protein ID866_10282 [Astraeus odoratus]